MLYARIIEITDFVNKNGDIFVDFKMLRKAIDETITLTTILHKGINFNHSKRGSVMITIYVEHYLNEAGKDFFRNGLEK